MAFIDSVVLNLTERSCRGFQRLTGRTNVWLALQLTNLSIIVYFVWAGLYAFNIDIELRVVAAVFCVALCMSSRRRSSRRRSRPMRRPPTSVSPKGLRNPRRIRDALLRTSFLTLCLVLAYPVLFVYQNLRTLPLQLKPNTTNLVRPQLPAHPADDERVVSAGVRSVAAVRGQSARVDARAVLVSSGPPGVGVDSGFALRFSPDCLVRRSARARRTFVRSSPTCCAADA
jgi:hypothetical protein